MATPAQIRTQVDNALATLWGAFQNKQDTYFANHGRYYQLILTHSVTPADGNSVVPDQLNLKPHYEAQSAQDLGINIPSVPFALECHQYVTPDGTCGYQAFVSVTIAGNTWMRSAQVGPETWRAFGWTQVNAGLGVAALEATDVPINWKLVALAYGGAIVGAAILEWLVKLVAH